MTIEEKAKQRAEEIEAKQTLGVYDSDEDLARDESWNDGYVSGFEDGYIEGAKENGAHWHKLNEDPNDLPPMIQDERRISERVWISVENWGTEDGHYDYNKNCWIIRCRIVNLPILGWCEIPEFG